MDGTPMTSENSSAESRPALRRPDRLRPKDPGNQRKERPEMRNPGSWPSLLVCAASLALARAPALADDVVNLDVPQQVRIGPLVLEPGSYVIRSRSAMENRNVLAVWTAGERTFVGFLPATYSTSKTASPTNEFVCDGKDGRVIRAWNVGRRGTTYSFSSAPESTALAARGNAGSVVAAR
jgi:hypothetical protein